MATTADLEKKVQSLETALNEAQDAVRRLGGQDNNLVSMVSKISAEVSSLKVEVANLKITVGKLADAAQKATRAGISRYE